MDEISDEQLISMAKEAAKKAYVPYSHFHVGSAVLSEDNYVYTGCNIENSSYGATNCAERTAIFKCVSDQKTRIKKIAIASDSNEFTWPCGICRQVMREFCNPQKMHVVFAKSTKDYKDMTLEELLPESFGPDALEK